MANVIINDTNLYNIADAIREKNGEATTYKPSEMAEAILAIEAGGGGGYMPTDEELTYKTNDFSTQGNNNSWVIREYGNRVKFSGNGSQNAGARWFMEYPYETFDAHPTLLDDVRMVNLGSVFESCQSKYINGSIINTDSVNLIVCYAMDKMFYTCSNVETINDNLIDYTKYRWNPQYGGFSELFSGCKKLKKIPDFVFKLMNNNSSVPLNEGETYTQNYNKAYLSMFNYCHSLEEIVNLPVVIRFYNSTTLTSNMFNGTFRACCNLSKLTFATNDGAPIVVNWSNQIIDLTHGSTQGIGCVGSSMTFDALPYENQLILDGNNPPTRPDNYLETGWSRNSECSKYGHREAVETINSLPDCSATGSNTIKFTGIQGKYTDYLLGRTDDNTFDSSINTLTDAEIAVATAKGWTVSLT